jgi:hypothetical protein
VQLASQTHLKTIKFIPALNMVSYLRVGGVHVVSYVLRDPWAFHQR